MSPQACSSVPAFCTMTNIGRLFVAEAVYASIAANCGRVAASLFSWNPLKVLPMMGRALSGDVPVQGAQPVCSSKPMSGEKRTPRTSIMSVPGRTGQALPWVSVTVTPLTTLS